MPAATRNRSQTRTIIDRHDQCMSINYGRYPIAMALGKGVMLHDAEGKGYLDLFAGFGASILGHCHDDLVQALGDQAQKLWHPGNLFHTEPQTRLAQAIARHGFGGQSFFCHSGADANEAALKLARLYGLAHPGPSGPRFKVISTLRSFHGRTFGTMAATGQAKVSDGFEPPMPGFVHVPFNDPDAVEQAIDDQTVAVIVEPIQGEGGVHVPDDAYLPKLRELCDKKKLLLITDEVWTGCGRTGRYFAYQHWNILPDIMTLAKGVGGGLAVGVMCAMPRIAKHFDWRNHGAAVHATTLGGNCLSMAVAAKIFEVIERDGLVEKAARLGHHAMARLRRFSAKHPIIKQVRGKGLFIGIEFADGPETAGDNRFTNAADVVNQCLDRGVVINRAAGSVLRLAPALIIEQDQLDRGLDVLEEVIAQ